MEFRRRFGIRTFIALTTAAQILTAAFGVLVLASSSSVTAVQSVPYLINFQGRLTDASGNALTDGSYNIKFRLFDAATSGVNRWEGDRVFGTSDNRITIANGLFNIQFGDTTQGDPALSPALFNNQTYPQLYLEVELPTPATATCATNGCAVFTEGAMTPRQPLASSPYAFNSDTLDGLDSSAFLQLSPGAAQSGNINVTGSIQAAASSGALTLGSTTNAGGIVFNDGTANNRAVTLNATGVAASYTLTFPTAVPNTGQCLQTSSGSAMQLIFGSCSGGVTTLQTAYNSSTDPEISLASGATKGLTIRDNASTVGNILEVQNSTGTTTYFAVTSTGAAVTGTLTAGTLNATSQIQIGGVQISSAALSNDANLTKQGNTFNGTSQLVQTNGSGQLPALSGTNLTSLNPTNFATGSGAVALASGGSSALTLTSASGTVILGSSTVQRVAAGLTLDVDNTAASTLTVTNSNASFVASLSVEGGVGIGSGQVFSVGATNGSTIAACTTGQYLSAQAATGGLVTGGSCATDDLQTAYANATTPATINLNTTAKDFVINATDQATDPNILFNLQCATCSAGAGRFAVQGNNTDILTVNPVGSIVISPLAGQNLSITQAGSSGTRFTASSVPAVDQINVDNTSTTGVATAGVSGMSINYKGSTNAIASGIEAEGMRIDFAPSTVNPTSGTNTWSGLRIVAASTGATSNNVIYGLKLEGPTSPGVGTEEGAYIGTGWDIGLDIRSGGMQLATQSDPAAPAAGNLRLYAKAVAGHAVPAVIGPAGASTPLQAAIWQNSIVTWMPGSAAGTWQGTAGGAVGTAAAVLPTTTNLYTAERRSTYAPASAAANIQCGIRSELMFFEGNAAGLGGFFASFHFGTSTWTAGDRLFVGFSTGTTGVTTVNPSTLTNIAGFGIDAGDAAITFMHNAGGGAATKDAIAGQPALASNQGYDAYIYMKPNDTTIYYRLDNTNTGATIIDTSTAANVPVASTMMAAHAEMGTGTNTTIASALLGINRIYVETDR